MPDQTDACLAVYDRWHDEHGNELSEQKSAAAGPATASSTAAAAASYDDSDNDDDDNEDHAEDNDENNDDDDTYVHGTVKTNGEEEEGVPAMLSDYRDRQATAVDQPRVEEAYVALW